MVDCDCGFGGAFFGPFSGQLSQFLLAAAIALIADVKGDQQKHRHGGDERANPD